ncbi:hypothetical protein E4P41_14135 [Geodermatophilus sp. DF01-2]|uniref:hypothetical protein n=1 Tax=Geodermatophilus sp. DF01-2 TaxID=2559610 RepID=UPI0010730522|nr:hypothetical protein [Geodermatophilus sp. DF01_2]TFV57722.1 hypothetical protein E4P41_14135 [Geodermatophilus sp. DF01_2]
MKRVLAWVAAAAVTLTGVLLLRAELMTVEVEQPEGSYTDVVVTATVNQEDPEAVREEMTRGLVSTCRLLVNADVAAESFRRVEPDVFAFRLRPGLDEFDRRELRGCLSDTRVQHLLVDVLHLQTVTPADPEPARAEG